jgi:hypothetical protein
MKTLTLIDLVLFMIAAAIAYPVAKMLSGHFIGAWRTGAFYTIMIVGYPLLGFTFQAWFGRAVRFFHRHKDASKDSQSEGK